MRKTLITAMVSFNIMLLTGCASDGFKRLGYDILSNHHCSPGDTCRSSATYRGQYQAQCMGGTALPNCDMAPFTQYNEYVEERDRALEDIRDNK